MLWLQRALALPMFGACIWLSWVLFRQAGLPGFMLLLAGAVVLLAALRLKPAAALGVLLLLPFLHDAPARPALTLLGAEAYAPVRLAALRAARQPVFVDLTAAWCVTCLVNENATLKDKRVRELFAARHITLLVGDWTERAPTITALLVENHRAGVPLYLYYPPGAAEPVVLPQILSPGGVARALTH
jgi:thiol:disulfide interchange protein DsbD